MNHNGLACTSPEVTLMGFKAYCISSTMDEADHMFWNDSEEVGNIRSKCEEYKGTDCEGGDGDTDW